MKRHRFDEGQQNRSAPDFRLTGNQGGSISLGDYRTRTNLVLFVANGLAERAYQGALEGFAVRKAQYQAQNAQVLGIIQATLPAMGIQDEASGPSFVRLLADPEGSTHGNCAALLPDGPEPDEAILFVLDRFGAPHVAFLSRDPADPVLHERLLSWLKGIEFECPE